MLEGSNEIRRGYIDDALRAARAEIVTWNAKDAGIDGIARCGLRGSPTVVKKVFAPPPRSEKAVPIELRPRRLRKPSPKPLSTKIVRSDLPKLEPESDPARSRFKALQRSIEHGDTRSPQASRGQPAASMKKELPEHFRDYKHVWVFIELERGVGASGLVRAAGRRPQARPISLASNSPASCHGRAWRSDADGGCGSLRLWRRPRLSRSRTPCSTDYRNEPYTKAHDRARQHATSRKSCCSARRRSAAILPARSRRRC